MTRERTRSGGGSEGPFRRAARPRALALLLALPLSLLASCVISDTGEGPELTAWQPTQPFSSQRTLHAACAYGGFMYVLGGSGTSGLLNDVQYAGINAYGALLPWGATTPFPLECFGHASVVANGFIYVTGGEEAPTVTLDGVRYGLIQSNGTVQTWRTATNPLPVARSKHASFAYGSKLFVVGGWNGFAPLADVRFAPLASNDTNNTNVGVWVVSNAIPPAEPISPPRHSHTSVVHDGFLYVIGGIDGTGALLAAVEYAPLASNGLLSGAWADATALPGPRAGHASFAYNGHLYVLGGRSGAGAYEDDVFYAKINGDGSLGSWGSTTPLKSAREGLAAVDHGIFAYVLGGQGASARLNDAWYAQFQ